MIYFVFFIRYRNREFVSMEEFIAPLPLPPDKLALHLKSLINGGRAMLIKQCVINIKLAEIDGLLILKRLNK
jgi:hypothetical protein